MEEEPLSRQLLQVAKVYLGAFSKQVEDLDLSRYHYILMLIADSPNGLTQKQIAELVSKDKSALVNIVDTLTAQGYVYREINPTDRRQQLIKVTDKALRDLPHIRQAFKLLNLKATEGIPASQLQVFNQVLQHMSTNLKSLSANKVALSIKKSKRK